MKKLICNSTAEFLIFTAQAGDDSIEVRVENETVWLTQKLMAELFGVYVRTISEHLRNIFQRNELQDDSVIWKFWITAVSGNRSWPGSKTRYGMARKKCIKYYTFSYN